MFWQLILVALALGAGFYRWSRRRIYQLAREVPASIKGDPILGLAGLVIGSSKDRMKAVQILGESTNEKGGLTSGWLANIFIVSMTDPADIEVVSKACLAKNEALIKFLRVMIGNGSIFAPVNIWHPRRKINAPFFSGKNLQRMVPVFEEKSATMVNLMQAEAGGGDFSIWKYMTSFTFDTVCETATGTRIDSQGNGEHFMLESINIILNILSKRMLQPWLHPNFIYDKLPVAKQLQRHIQRATSFADKIIQDRRNEMAAMESNENMKNNNDDDQISYLETIMNSYSDMELREEVLVMIVAGNDTSAVASSFTSVLLSRYPDVQDKVYQELKEVFGDSDRAVSSEDLRRLTYLDAVIKESLRLYPPVPAVGRDVCNDVVLPSGPTLVDGVMVLFNIWGAHRNPSYWGADAELFRPERFLQGPLPHPAMFIPFSYSVRNCIGSSYAMLSIKTGLANLLRRYRLLPPAGMQASDLTRPIPVKYEIMMKADDDFILRIEERNKTM